MSGGEAPGPDAVDPTAPRRRAAMPPGQEVLAVEAVVELDRGRWVVHLDVLLPDGARRIRAGDFPDRERAEQAARIMARNARRHLPPGADDP